MKNVYSVGQINSYIKNMFTQDFMLRSVYVRGEVSNVKYHPSNHIYFTMKDATGSLNCVMFAGNRAGLKFKLTNGQQIICGGSVSVYERDGRYQIYAKDIVLDGDGILYEKYEQLKKELEETGMFSKEYKQDIPKYATKVGIVTASTGAAVQDIINVSKRRNPYVQLILYPALVQGDGAKESIVAGIRALDRLGVDVIIVGRGGGSIEDLWAFNEEIVARAIFECRTPVISAVGHETDTTIADYVADLRAPTPSAAAELAVFDYNEYRQRVADTNSRLQTTIYNKLSSKKRDYKRAELLVERLNPDNILKSKKMRHMYNEERLIELMQNIIKNKKHEYEIYINKMRAISPLEKLSGGYAYTKGPSGKAIKSVKDVNVNDNISIYVKDGEIKANVVGIM